MDSGSLSMGSFHLVTSSRRGYRGSSCKAGIMEILKSRHFSHLHEAKEIVLAFRQS